MTQEPTNVIVMYSTAWCGDCRRAKRFFDQHSVAYQNIDIEQDPTGRAVVEQINRGRHSVPTIVFPDGSVLVEPSNAELAAKLT